MEDWLRRRLTPAKQKISRWNDLAKILETLWETFYDPEISRTQRLRSSYTADDQDLFKKIREMGDYFSFDLPKTEDRPVALAWRRLELEYKDVEFIVQSALRRHFGDFPCTWYPLFAPTNKPYGTEFVVGEYLSRESDKNIAPEGYFLTSRGILGIDKRGLLVNNITKEEFKKISYPLIVRTKPLHIVFDGYCWFTKIDIEEFKPDFSNVNISEHSNISTSEQSAELQFSLKGTRFDYFPGDLDYLDIDQFSLKREIDRKADFFFPERGTLGYDIFFLLIDSVFNDQIPLDIISIESANHANSLFFQLFRETVKSNTIKSREIIPNIIHKNTARKQSFEHASDLRFNQRSIHRGFVVDFIQKGLHVLDRFLIDSNISDLIPIDIMKVKINENQFFMIYKEGVSKCNINMYIPNSIPERLSENTSNINIDINFSSKILNKRNSQIEFINNNDYIDRFVLDGQSDNIPIDTYVNKPFSVIHKDITKDAEFIVKECILDQKRDSKKDTFIMFDNKNKLTNNTTRNVDVRSFEAKSYCLDQYMYLDDFSCDTEIPLDLLGRYM